MRWSVTLPDRWQGAVVNISLSDKFYLTAVAEYAANELRCYLCRKNKEPELNDIDAVIKFYLLRF